MDNRKSRWRSKADAFIKIYNKNPEFFKNMIERYCINKIPLVFPNGLMWIEDKKK